MRVCGVVVLACLSFVTAARAVPCLSWDDLGGVDRFIDEAYGCDCVVVYDDNGQDRGPAYAVVDLRSCCESSPCDGDDDWTVSVACNRVPDASTCVGTWRPDECGRAGGLYFWCQDTSSTPPGLSYQHDELHWDRDRSPGDALFLHGRWDCEVQTEPGCAVGGEYPACLWAAWFRALGVSIGAIGAGFVVTRLVRL